MKKLLLLPLALVVLAGACSKNEAPAIKTAPAGNTVHSTSRLDPKIKFVYWKLEGKLHCVPPAENCIEDMSPWISFTEIDSAIASGSVKDFFNTVGWEDHFPYMEYEPEVVHGLQTGEYTMVRKTNDGDNTEAFYVVINAAEDPDNYEQALLVVNPHFD